MQADSNTDDGVVVNVCVSSERVRTRSHANHTTQPTRRTPSAMRAPSTHSGVERQYTINARKRSFCRADERTIVRVRSHRTADGAHMHSKSDEVRRRAPSTHSDVERQFTTRDDARQADTKKRSLMPERERRVRTATTPTVVHGAAALMIECALARQRARRSTDASKHSRESRHGCRNAHTRTEQRAQQRRAAHTNNARNERSYTSQSTVY